MKIKVFAAYLMVSCLVFGLTTSCEKKTDCKLTITTVDASGFALSNIKVKLYANVKTSSGSTVEADLKAEGTSDGSGSSTYTFKLPAILDIRAIGTNSMIGTGIIKLEEGKSVEKTITVK
jgi:hypothetical protein